MVDDKDGWSEWAHRVLGDIERIDRQNKDILLEISALRIDVAILKTKAAFIGGLWGTIMGVIAGIVVKLIFRGQ
jgi:hypothetical protein